MSKNDGQILQQQRGDVGNVHEGAGSSVADSQRECSPTPSPDQTDGRPQQRQLPRGPVG